MPTITRIEIFQVDLEPHVARSDAIQTFSTQETPMMRVFCDDGSKGVGYSYTIGTGGSSVVALLRDHLAPRLLGRDPSMVEEIWKELFFHTHATSVGAVTSIALCVVDMALWDLRCRRAHLPLHVVTPEIIASLEYGAAVLGTKVILVMGHSGCGAVKASIDGKGVPGQISALFPHIRPAVDLAGSNVEGATKANAKFQARLLREASTVISELVRAGKLRVEAGYYDLGTGAVQILS